MTAFFSRKADKLKASKKYLETLLQYYEEEVSGEAYFYALVSHFEEKEKLKLLARVERHAAQSVLPLLHKYGLVSRDESKLRIEGERYVERHESITWQAFMAYIADRYQGYLDDFAALENMAPIEDLPALNILTDHEVAAIMFAEKELMGDPTSVDALHDYLDR